MPTWCAVVLACCLIYLGFIVWAQARFHSYRFALDYVRGARLQVDPPTHDLGTQRIGERFETAITIRNHGRTPITILGALSSCSCVAHRGLPRMIPSGAEAVLTISVHIVGKPGAWWQSVRYLTDSREQPGVTAYLRCEVLDPGPRSLPSGGRGR